MPFLNVDACPTRVSRTVKQPVNDARILVLPRGMDLAIGAGWRPAQVSSRCRAERFRGGTYAEDLREHGQLQLQGQNL